MEVVGLGKKGEKNDAFVNFKDNSTVLDKILDYQRSPCDKTVLGYKRTKKNMKMTLGLRRIQKQAHKRPKMLPMLLHMKTGSLEAQNCNKELVIFLK